jgi:hypothetical protein
VIKMTDVRCPVCGKWNSEEEEFCQFCSTRLIESKRSTPSKDTKNTYLLQSNETRRLDDLSQEDPHLSSKKPGPIPSQNPFETKILSNSHQPGEDPGKTGELEPFPSGDKTGEIWPLATDENSATQNPAFTPNIPTGTGGNEALPVDIPQWLSGITTQNTQENPEPSKLPFEQIDPEMPDWLADLEPEKSGEQRREDQKASFDPDKPPEWLVNLQSEENKFGDQPETVQSPPFSGDGWISPDQEQTPPFSSRDLPDWLARLSLPDEDLLAVSNEPRPGPENGEEITLAPAELPGWVQSLRPVETATPSSPLPDMDDLMEKAGPLEGLRGVLPPESLVPEIHKSVAYSVSLQVTEKQRINSTLLENILSAEGKPKILPQKRVFPSLRILRILIACVLILGIWIPLWLNSRFMQTPSYITAEVSDVQNVINTFSSDSMVLLAFDYEPALSGEIKAVASGVVAHLMAQSANLVLLSTNPLGQALGEQILADSQKSQPNYNLAEKTTNLGYLAGGSSGLFNFAIQPRLAAPVTTDQNSAWTQPNLANIQSISGFSGVILITESADTARTWIEQVTPVLGEVPLVMVTSAQVGPILQPYYDAGQIQGYISGLTAGSMYETNTSFSGSEYSSIKYWDSYQIGIIFTLIIIIFGGLIASGEALLSHRKFWGKG